MNSESRPITENQRYSINRATIRNYLLLSYEEDNIPSELEGKYMK